MKKRIFILLAVGIFLLLPIYDKHLWIDEDPFDFSHIVALKACGNIEYVPEYGPYLLYFCDLLGMPQYLFACVAMQEEEYRLSMLPGFVMYFVAWLLVFAYHCFMLILPFKLKTFLQAEKKNIWLLHL